MRGLQLTCIVLLATTTGSNALVVPLDRWTFRSANGSVRVDNASVPGTSHIHLMEAGVIGDPYYRFNERENQWVAQETWTYETHVTLPSDDINSKKTSLVFETLDGVALVTVNGKQVAITANSFVPYRIDAAAVLLPGVNQIQVEFQPVLQYTREQADTYPYFVPATENFNTWTEPTRRSFVRKAGSDFGWDWGPAFVTSGIAGAAYIEFTESVVKLKDLQVGQVFPVGNEDLSNVDVTVRVTLDGGKVKHENVTFDLFINDKKETSIMTTIPEDWQEDAVIDISFRLENPKLWWPAGYGEPYLYDLRVDAWNAEFSSSLSHKSGIRHVELVQDDTNAGYVAGKTFYFKINCVPIFIKGANWIPTDSFPTRTKASTVRHLLESVRAANMNMLRVWGGGRYESDLFYVECDRLGILVWQELMFACGMYPRDTAFLQNVLKEVGFQVSRLRKYTSIAIWGGNNENENMMEQFVEAPIFPPGTTFNRDIAVVDFTKLFVDLIHPTIAAMDSSRPFVDTSPSNGLYSVDPYVKRWGPSNGVAFGDVHFYDYNNDCQDYRMYPRARFISEFGFQSWPSAASLHDVSSKEDWDSFQSFWKFLKYRERHENGTTQMLTQLTRRFHVPFPFRNEKWLGEVSGVQSDESFGFSTSGRIESYLYLTQIQQSLCYQTAIQTWRRGKNPELGMTMGILYWQLNDIWQGSSWSSIEYSGRWKSLHYVAKRQFAPFIISIHERSDGEAVEVYAVSDVNENLHIDVVYELRRTKCGSLVKTIDRQAIAIAALESRSIEELDIDKLLDHDTTSCHRRSCFLHVRCVAKSSVTGLETAACEDTHHFFAPYKYLNLGWGEVAAHSVVKTEAENVVVFSVELVATDFVALFVEVDAPSVLGYWSSNSFLMVGHETKTLNFTEAASEDADKLSVDAFSRLITVNWLQKSYDNSVEDMAVQ
ncbi:Beta-mannosidase [Phytophthora cactorum]|uniref:Beta-mannosidase B n=1 Tax=Phytophthora cactorum TaxID=29920 RepID=A0A329SRC4_9STRA|nr:Beta-mannosidase [Phytophthora cactorum]KAG2843465.1 Beta-mannosidase [Phytophthora cactorum]KAG2868089.1 Beta-mannosidase [Phytophthora cactorum]KAG2928089.1 Beta-mannosidase [Phytophthora cactorum]KAG2939808.1 Beta-mannosidase [Phytophthora cactorum]